MSPERRSIVVNYKGIVQTFGFSLVKFLCRDKVAFGLTRQLLASRFVFPATTLSRRVRYVAENSLASAEFPLRDNCFPLDFLPMMFLQSWLITCTQRPSQYVLRSTYPWFARGGEMWASKNMPNKREEIGIDGSSFMGPWHFLSAWPLQLAPEIACFACELNPTR